MKIEKLEDIANLPWKGNFHADRLLFAACDAFIDTLPLEQRERAEDWPAWFGMGEGHDPRATAHIRKAMDLIEQHDNKAGNSPELDAAYEALQQALDLQNS